MKTTGHIVAWLATVLSSQIACAQIQKHQPTNTVSMKTIVNQNKEAIRTLYEVILNHREFEKLDAYVSQQYSNSHGGVGLEGFKKGITDVINAFSDAQWSIEELAADGNTVIVKQKVQGTHTGTFQNIQPTHKTISNEGFAVYKFDDHGKIVSHQIQTDRLSFLQQLGVLPVDITSLQPLSR